MVKRLLLLISFLVGLGVCKSIDPIAYQPELKPEAKGFYAPNAFLQKAQFRALGKVEGLESLAVDSFGRIYGGDRYGNILRINADDSLEVLCNTGGRPLGIQFDTKGNLVIADAFRGLLLLSPSGNLSILANQYDGKAFAFVDDLDIGKDGKIYFSDASIYPQNEYLYDLLESRPHGRVFVYNPLTKTVELLADQLYFANGIALSKNEDFLLVNETYRYQITKIFLQGPKKGKREIFIQNLPGFPDNITRNEKGEFWLALFTVRNDRMDSMHPAPWKKKLISMLPKIFWPKPEPYGYVLKLGPDGQVLLSLQDPGGHFLKEITSAVEVNETLYLGSLYNDRIGVLPIRDLGKLIP